MIINQAILHIMDFNSGITVFSEKELDLSNESIITFLTKHIEKLYNDQRASVGAFHSTSNFKMQLVSYVNHELEFIPFSKFIAERIYSAIAQSDQLDSADLIICDVMVEDTRFLAVLKCNNRIGFTHQVVKEEDTVRNEIINHYAILPAISQKIDEYALINTDSLELKFVDKQKTVNGVDTCIMADCVLECSTKKSPSDTLKIMNSVTRTVAENYGQDTVAAVSMAKNFIKENAEISAFLDPVEVGKKVFAASPAMQKEYEEEIQKAGIGETVKVDPSFALRKGKSHKIKTDTGIEITIPVEYFQNEDYIEIINNPDGTLSIALKNIGKLINK